MDSTQRKSVASRSTAWMAPRTMVIVSMVLLTLYVVFGLGLGNAPMQDLPDHLARAHIIADLLYNKGAQFGDLFALKLSFSPYLGGDLLFATLDRVLGTVWACRVWVATSIALLPLSVCFVLRRLGTNTRAGAAAALLALYVATDRFFIYGFANYLVSVALAFFTYGWFCSATRSGKPAAYAGFVLLLLLSYVIHLTALVFLLVITGISSLLWVLDRRLSLRRALALMVAPAVLVLFQLVTTPAMDLIGQAMHAATAAAQPAAGAVSWSEAARSKIVGSGFPAERFNMPADITLFALLMVAAVFPIAASGRRALRTCGAQLLIAGVLGVLYLLTPATVGGVWYAAVRPLQYALLFLILAGALSAELRPGVQRAQFALAFVIAVANLAYLAAYMLPENSAMQRYKALTANIPRNAKVLPIDTRPFRYYRPFLHAGAYATLEAHAPTPYLFAADIVPNMPYFQYLARPAYAPHESWYSLDTRVAWDQVAREYQYLLVTVPWDTGRILVPYSVVARNDVAALLKVEANR